MNNNQTSIESILHEDRLFAPAERCGGSGSNSTPWHIDSIEKYKELHQLSISDPDKFYKQETADLHWFKPWTKAVEFTAPDAKWFIDGQTNLCYNCVDRHIENGYGDSTAIIWESEPLNANGQPEIKTISYNELHHQISKCGSMLKSLGVKQGDVVTIYMGMVPELIIAVLACARIGAAHSVIFGGFSAQAIADRVSDAESKVILTCDGLYRRGKVVPLKDSVDQARKILGNKSSVTDVVFVTRCNNDISFNPVLDRRWEDLINNASPNCPAEPLDAEQMSFLLYTSGSTGKPKGIVHTVGGYMVHTYLTAKYVFNLVPEKNQIFWCTADIGWITGHSYSLYGVMANRIPTVIYEGAPNAPDEGRFWQIIEKHKVTHFYTAPTAIRSFMKWGRSFPDRYDLSSLQVLGSVGEPINPEAWIWYQEVIGKNRCPIVDTYWQTETGGHVITPLPGAVATKPGSCTLPFFGVDAAVVNSNGTEVGANEGGLLVIRKPWPGMLRGVYGDRIRYIDTYWSTIKIDGQPVYTAGDGARRDSDGYFWIMGRVDDVINVSGHRLGTMEVESALVAHPAVVEAAVVGMPHEIKGTGIAAFVTLEGGISKQLGYDQQKLKEELTQHVTKEIGTIAKPDLIRFTDTLPKTRSGKIMRRLLRDIASGNENVNQDTSTLEDLGVLAKLRETDE